MTRVNHQHPCEKPCLGHDPGAWGSRDRRVFWRLDVQSDYLNRGAPGSVEDTVSENKLDDRGGHSHTKQRHSIKDDFFYITFAFLESLRKAGCWRMPPSHSIQKGIPHHQAT